MKVEISLKGNASCNAKYYPEGVWILVCTLQLQLHLFTSAGVVPLKSKQKKCLHRKVVHILTSLEEKRVRFVSDIYSF